MSVDEPTKPIRVFVHLSHFFGATHWQKYLAAGKLTGINDRLPYGYYRAAEDGCSIVYSEDKNENRLERLGRLGLKFLIGVDLVHAWRNRKGLYDADIIWTHTELQYIAVLLLFQIFFWKRRPRLIAQSVWLFDRWHRLSWPRRWFLSYLITQADILTVLSPENLKVARSVFPDMRSELVLFGINADEFVPVKNEKVHHPLHILSLGNDRDRDWPVLIEALKDFPDCCLTIASWTVTEKELGRHGNVEMLKVYSNKKLSSLYEWADFVVLTINENLHASGITILQEAALMGVPVICSDTGGLKAYFSDEEVYFIPHGDPTEIQKAIAKLAGDDPFRWGLAKRAQARMQTGGVNSRSYARRHAELSKELLARDTGRRTAKTAGPAA